jgi:hypothetical protein
MRARKRDSPGAGAGLRRSLRSRNTTRTVTPTAVARMVMPTTRMTGKTLLESEVSASAGASFDTGTMVRKLAPQCGQLVMRGCCLPRPISRPQREQVHTRIHTTPRCGTGGRGPGFGRCPGGCAEAALSRRTIAGMARARISQVLRVDERCMAAALGYNGRTSEESEKQARAYPHALAPVKQQHEAGGNDLLPALRWGSRR